MYHTIPFTPDWRSNDVLCAMHAARKRVFVDLLGWDVPVRDELYEVDQFDLPGAIYLILTDESGAHRASARLLPTGRPHILDSLFGDLCAGTPPSGPDTMEITRFCLDRRLNAAARRHARNELLSSFVDHALACGITTYTGVAERSWFAQLLAVGWACRGLGEPKLYGAQTLAAIRIEIDRTTPALMTATGVYQPSPSEAEVRHAA